MDSSSYLSQQGNISSTSGRQSSVYSWSLFP